MLNGRTEYRLTPPGTSFRFPKTTIVFCQGCWLNALSCINSSVRVKVVGGHYDDMLHPAMDRPRAGRCDRDQTSAAFPRKTNGTMDHSVSDDRGVMSGTSDLFWTEQIGG